MNRKNGKKERSTTMNIIINNLEIFLIRKKNPFLFVLFF